MINLKPKYWKQILLLLIITPILTELLTNNIPARQFFKVKTFFALLILGYAPVLLLRELAVRYKLGFTGYILLGLVYGFYNEGLLAQTIFHAQIPNPTFNNYGVAWGINFPWTVIILIFHAFYAFLFPILFIYYFSPLAARKPWLNKTLWLSISALLFIYISLKFLKNIRPPVTLLHYIFLISTMALLVGISNFFKNTKMFEVKSAKVWPLCLYGFIFVIAVFAVSDALIKSGTNPGVFILYLFALLFITVALLKNKTIQTLMVFCLSAEIAFAACALLVAKITNSTSGMITEVVFIAVFLLTLVIIILKRKSYEVKNQFTYRTY